MFPIDHNHVLLGRLNRHTQMHTRVESLLAMVEDAERDCERADAAERRVIEGRCQMGNEALTAWAERGVEKQTVLGQAEPE